jgi:hypothetical protein
MRARLAFALPIALSLLIYLPGLWADHYNDDWSQRLIAEGRGPGFDSNPLGLFEFTRSRQHAQTLTELGVFPWWSSPSLHLQFFRPLSSAMIAFEHRAFGDTALVSHVHSLLWFVAVLALASRLYRTLLTPRVALLATWVSAMSPHTVTGALWTAARNGMCAAAVTLLALDLHARARKEGRDPPRAAIAALFALGLCFGEISLGFVPLLIAIEWALTPDARWSRRLPSLAPTLAITGVFLPAYVGMGYGAGGSGLFLDPSRDLAAVVRELPVRLGVLLLDGTWAVPSEIYLVLPAARAGLATVGALTTVALALWLYRTRAVRVETEHRALVALLGGSVCAIAPGLFGILGGRLLSIGFVGFCATVAALWDAALTWRARKPVFAWSAVVSIVLVRGALATLFRLAQVAQIVLASRAERSLAVHHEIRCPLRADFALVDGADPSLGMYAAPALALVDRRLGGTFRMLSMQPETLVLTRTGPRSITLEPTVGTLTSFVFAEVFRSPREPLVEGAVLRHGAVETRVLRVVDGRPQRAEFTFRAPFEGGGSCLLRWQGGRLRSFDPPPVGSSMRVAHERGPLGI